MPKYEVYNLCHDTIPKTETIDNATLSVFGYIMGLLPLMIQILHHPIQPTLPTHSMRSPWYGPLSSLKDLKYGPLSCKWFAIVFEWSCGASELGGPYNRTIASTWHVDVDLNARL